MEENYNKEKLRECFEEIMNYEINRYIHKIDADINRHLADQGLSESDIKDLSGIIEKDRDELINHIDYMTERFPFTLKNVKYKYKARDICSKTIVGLLKRMETD